jgi:hypothetical protein
MSSTVGLEVKGGEDYHLVIGDRNPVLSRMQTGRLTITRTLGGYGFCVVTYSNPVKDTVPPLVFTTPTASCNGKGIGLFSHIGNQGNWTGFSVVAVGTLFGTGGAIGVGLDTGWDYHVCVFGQPNTPETTFYGLSVCDDNGTKIFSSTWDLVLFKNLMQSWSFNSFTRSYNSPAYWGNEHYNLHISWDDVIAKATHAWQAADGDTGILISGLGALPLRADVGFPEEHTQDCAVMIGFPDSGRANLWASIFYGKAQHPSADITALNSFKLLLGDFKRLNP